VFIHRYLFDLGSHVNFRVNEQRVVIVVLENLRGRFRDNIPSFKSRPKRKPVKKAFGPGWVTDGALYNTSSDFKRVWPR